MWKRVRDESPEKEGRYFVMYTMVPAIIDGEMVRKNFAGVCTYRSGGFRVEVDILNVTHWMEIPKVEDAC